MSGSGVRIVARVRLACSRAVVSSLDWRTCVPRKMRAPGTSNMRSTPDVAHRSMMMGETTRGRYCSGRMFRSIGSNCGDDAITMSRGQSAAPHRIRQEKGHKNATIGRILAGFSPIVAYPGISVTLYAWDSRFFYADFTSRGKLRPCHQRLHLARGRMNDSPEKRAVMVSSRRLGMNPQAQIRSLLKQAGRRQRASARLSALAPELILGRVIFSELPSWRAALQPWYSCRARHRE